MSAIPQLEIPSRSPSSPPSRIATSSSATMNAAASLFNSISANLLTGANIADIKQKVNTSYQNHASDSLGKAIKTLLYPTLLRIEQALGFRPKAKVTLDENIQNLFLLRVANCKFIRIKRLGSGKFGTAYKYKIGNNFVVIKLPGDRSKDTLKLHEKEQAALYLTRGRRIISILGVTENHGTILPLADTDLNAQLQLEKKMRVATIYTIVMEVLEGLADLEKSGVANCDIKPHNILLRNGHVLITDFGFAELQDKGYEKKIWGSPPFMAPEKMPQLFKQEKDQSKVDVWSLGAMIAYLVLHGKEFFFPKEVIPTIIRKRDPLALTQELANERIACIVAHEKRVRGPVSTRLMEIMRLCIVVDVAKRPTATKILSDLLAHVAPSAKAGHPPFILTPLSRTLGSSKFTGPPPFMLTPLSMRGIETTTKMQAIDCDGNTVSLPLNIQTLVDIQGEHQGHDIKSYANQLLMMVTNLNGRQIDLTTNTILIAGEKLYVEWNAHKGHRETPIQYRPPERLFANEFTYATPEGNMWQIGALLYYLLHGSEHLIVGNPLEQLERIKDNLFIEMRINIITAIRGSDESFCHIVERMLHQNPKSRPKPEDLLGSLAALDSVLFAN